MVHKRRERERERAGHRETQMKAKQIADLTTATFSEDLLTNTLLSPRCHTTVLLFVLNVFLNEYLSKKMLLLFKHHLTLSDKMSSNNTLSCVITSNYTLIWPPSLFGEKVDIYMYIYIHTGYCAYTKTEQLVERWRNRTKTDWKPEKNKRIRKMRTI